MNNENKGARKLGAGAPSLTGDDTWRVRGWWHVLLALGWASLGGAAWWGWILLLDGGPRLLTQWFNRSMSTAWGPWTAGFVGLALLLIILHFFTWLSGLVPRWLRCSTWVGGDVLLASAAAAGVATVAFANRVLFPMWAYALAFGLMGTVLVLRVMKLPRTQQIATPLLGGPRRRGELFPENPPDLFESLLQKEPLGPLSDFDRQDRFEMKLLVDQLYRRAAASRRDGLTLGLEGAWGTGKTTVLHELARKLTNDGYPVARLDSWAYREPGNLVTAYFDAVAGALRERYVAWDVRHVFSKFVAGLEAAPVSLLATFARLARSVFGRWSPYVGDNQRRQLRAWLERLDKPCVVLIDDLDRLEGDEIQAVFRSLRLTSDLPNVTHVLAYDRAQIQRALNLGGDDAAFSRDFLAKIVSVEVSISEPPHELRARRLEELLAAPLSDTGYPSLAELAKDCAVPDPRSILAEALTTPREIRRVTAAVALIWGEMKQHLNLLDLRGSVNRCVNGIRRRSPEVWF